MKNKKGFTLVELLAVIALLSVITMFAYPNIAKISTGIYNKYEYSIKKIIENGASVYVNNNIEEINNILSNNERYCLPVAKIAAYDYISTPIFEKNGNEINMKRCVYITKKVVENKIKFKYEFSNDIVQDGIDFLPPILSLKNKDNSNINCELNMYNKAINKKIFEENCEVIASDNDSSITFVMGTNLFLETITNDDILILKYIAVDNNNNKSKPLKIKLKNN